MPERIDGLTREDIRELFAVYARTNSLDALRALAEQDARFQRPIFHAMLRQEHLSLESRTDLDPELKEGILRKYHLFFQFLHENLYRELIKAIVSELPPVPKDARLRKAASPDLGTPRSLAELAMSLICEICNLVDPEKSINYI